MKRGSSLALTIVSLVLLAVVPEAHATGRPAPRITLLAATTVVAESHLGVEARLSQARKMTVKLEKRVARRWVSVASKRSRNRQLQFSVPVGRTPGTLSLRARLVRGTRTMTVSRVVRVRVVARQPFVQSSVTPQPPAFVPEPSLAHGSSEGATYDIPVTTRLYDSDDITTAADGPIAGSTTVTLLPGVATPVVGGHVALGVAPGLPDGMFGEVLATDGLPDGSKRVVVTPAPMSDVLKNLKIDFNAPVTPELVDENGVSIGAAQSGGALVLRSSGSTFASGLSSLDAPFECETSGGVPISADDAWETDNPFPIELRIQNVRAQHTFDPGNLLTARAPFMLLQLSGEAVAAVGFKAKAGFSCELSTSFRRNHRLRMRMGSIGPVPVSAYLEPAIKFEVSASGAVRISQRHHFAVTLEKNGFEPLDARFAHSKDPLQYSQSRELNVSLFAGGDLSVMAGGGRGSANAQAGIAGVFGPELSISPSSGLSGCVDLNGAFKAELQARLELWEKRWNVELASMTIGPSRIAGPKCVFDHGVSTDVPGDPTLPAGPPAAFAYESDAPFNPVAYPMGDGRWLVADRYADTEWNYTVISETGATLNAWSASYDPLSVVSASDGTTFLAGVDRTGSDAIHLVRIAPGGSTRKVRTFTPSPYAPGMQHLAMSPGGRLFWLYSLAPGMTQGVAEIDTTTLERISSKPLGFDNGGITPTPMGLVINSYASRIWRIPYSAFVAGDDSLFDFGSGQPSQQSGGDLEIAVGLDGTVTDLDYFPYDCAGRTVTRRGADGSGWSVQLDAVLGDAMPPGCEIQDVDVRADGQVVVTLTSDSATYLARITREGTLGSMIKVGDDNEQAYSTADGTGAIVTTHTALFTCAPAEQDPNCARVHLTRVADDAVAASAVIAGPRDAVSAALTGHVGQPHFAIGNNQILIRTNNGDRTSLPHLCRRSCSLPGDFQLRSVVFPVTMSGRASFSWWGG